MKLKAWLDAQTPSVTQSAFAERVGRDPATVTKWIQGVAVPDSPAMKLIMEHTAGAVTPNDFFDVPGASTADVKTPDETLLLQPQTSCAALSTSKNCFSKGAVAGEAAE